MSSRGITQSILGVSIKVILKFGVCVFVCINEMKKERGESSE